MMLYPEEHFWTVPTIPGLYDDNDYSGKVLSSVDGVGNSFICIKYIFKQLQISRLIKKATNPTGLLSVENGSSSQYFSW